MTQKSFAVPFYEKLGFQKTEGAQLENGIKVYLMKNEVGFVQLFRKRYFLLAFPILFTWLVLSYPEMNRRFTYKSRQSEAKALLAGLLSAQKLYKKDKNEYSSNLNDIDFKADSANWYILGYSEACRKGNEVLNSLESFRADKVRQGMYARMKEVFKKLPCDPSFPVHWEAYAVGDASGAVPDIWRMDSEGQLILVQDGLAGTSDL